MTISAQTFISVVLCFTVFGAVQGAVAYCILLERKICSWIQDRIGPNRVGPLGLFQPLADGLKLFFKEDYTPRVVDWWLFMLAPCFITVPAMIGWAIVPWGGDFNFPGLTLGPLTVEPGMVHMAAATVNIGVIYLLAIGGVGIYGVVLGGWASNNKYSFLGGLRATAQMISYEIPLGVALLIVLLMSGSLLPHTIIADQVDTMWYVFTQPLAAMIYFIAILAEANRSPFDLAEAEQELVGGYHTEYASMKWALFFFAEYNHMITASAIFSVVFLGGWHIFPFVNQPVEAGLLGMLLKIGVLSGKVAFLIVAMMVIRWTLPRFRYDQLMDLAWKKLIPISGILLLATTVLIYLGYTDWYWMLGMNVAVVAVLMAIQPFMPKAEHTNTKKRLEGSRFYGLSATTTP